MCFSYKKKFCLYFTLDTGTKLAIILDILYLLEYLIIYLLVIVMSEKNFDKIIGFFYDINYIKVDDPIIIEYAYKSTRNYLSISYI
jgi:hypothetical protein